MCCRVVALTRRRVLQPLRSRFHAPTRSYASSQLASLLGAVREQTGASTRVTQVRLLIF